MSGLGMMGQVAMRRFDGICKTLAARGQGLTMQRIGDAGALARALAAQGPLDSSTTNVADVPGLVRRLRTRLELDDDDRDLAQHTP